MAMLGNRFKTYVGEQLRVVGIQMVVDSIQMVVDGVQMVVNGVKPMYFNCAYYHYLNSYSKGTQI